MGNIAAWNLTLFLIVVLIAAVVIGIVYVARKGVPQRLVRRGRRRE